MATVTSENEKVSLENIKTFEDDYNVTLPEEYKNFLLEYNGGDVNPNVFKISDEQGESALNTLYGLNISAEYDELSSVFDSLEGELPQELLSIGDDSGGNQICIGISGNYFGKIYIWMHDIEEGEYMDNVFFLANNFNEFLDSLYEDEEE
ncbi:SMI1/KNR4 family protein [Bacillus sp. CLL-7-23]|uniref:SMI1/KNR4 family protein n=1 Tax=Bacillus changyiensis TaxID=3004103 RepID=A0ABT4X3I1_9BACI|nr:MULTISPECIES: SMI1/KNR4 family protein [Bacillus]MDA7026852.1 SMI1/KNR4 family protein [Bacillus changyiensis]NPC91685.1 SMI1/KNR4 family protein [Bacillus sp. WMMC1349]